MMGLVVAGGVGGGAVFSGRGGGGATITCNQSSTSAADFTSDLSTISNAQTLCLTNAVDYGTFPGTNKTITIISQSASGAPNPVANSMTVDFSSGDSGFTIDGGMARWDSPVGLSINGGTITTGASNITLKNFKTTDPGNSNRLWVFDPPPLNSNILFDHWVLHDDLNGEASFYVEPATGTTDTGLTWRHGLSTHTSTDTFKVSGPNPVHILGNKIIDSHGSYDTCTPKPACENHTDGVQPLEGKNHEIVGNWIQSCDQAVFGDDIVANLTVKNNVVVNCGEHWITLGGDQPGSNVRNNTFVSTSGFTPTIPPVIVCGNNDTVNPFGVTMLQSQTTIIDNVAREISLAGENGGITCAPTANHHNLLNSGESTSGTGGSNFTGTTTFVGGSNPLTFGSICDFALVPGTDGYDDASDGGQVGVGGGGFNCATDGPPSGEGF